MLANVKANYKMWSELEEAAKKDSAASAAP
jgi:hypothetical protein